jgi:copper transport protein
VLPYRTLALCLLALLLAPASASAHAELSGTSPRDGARLASAPPEVTFRFDEAVEAGFTAVHVRDARGKAVEAGRAFHPGGRGRILAVRLPATLPEGGYTAVFRTLSADSHPISGGFTFTVGAGGAAARPVAEALSQSAGPVTSTALGAARAVQYAAIALAAGVLLFWRLVWRPVAPSGAFQPRVRRLLSAAAVAGIVSAVAAIVLQAAVGRGATAWGALDEHGLSDVLSTRVGRVFAAAAVCWAVVFVVETSSIVVVPLAALCLVPALSGHAGSGSPAWAWLPANIVHVVAVSAWIGGLAALVAASGVLGKEAREHVLARFGRLAGGAVAAVLATGVAQSLSAMDAWADLVETAYGRSVLIKLGLFALLIGFGAANRRRGTGAGSVLRAELAVAVVVLGVTGALSTYPPGDSAPSGANGASAGRPSVTLGGAGALARRGLALPADGGLAGGRPRLRLLVSPRDLPVAAR